MFFAPGRNPVVSAEAVGVEPFVAQQLLLRQRKGQHFQLDFGGCNRFRAPLPLPVDIGKQQFDRIGSGGAILPDPDCDPERPPLARHHPEAVFAFQFVEQVRIESRSRAQEIIVRPIGRKVNRHRLHKTDLRIQFAFERDAQIMVVRLPEADRNLKRINFPARGNIAPQFRAIPIGIRENLFQRTGDFDINHILFPILYSAKTEFKLCNSTCKYSRPP